MAINFTSSLTRLGPLKYIKSQDEVINLPITNNPVVSNKKNALNNVAKPNWVIKSGN